MLFYKTWAARGCQLCITHAMAPKAHHLVICLKLAFGNCALQLAVARRRAAHTRCKCPAICLVLASQVFQDLHNGLSRDPER